MDEISAEVHELWKKYLERGGLLNQLSFVKFQKRYPEVLSMLEACESSSRDREEVSSNAREDGFDYGLTRITPQYCAAFVTLQEDNLTLSDTSGSPIYWRSNNWRVRESLLLLNDPTANHLKEES